MNGTSTETNAVPWVATEGFPLSEIPPRESTMNLEFTRAMAEHGEPINNEQLQEMLAEHRKFLDDGGGGKTFTMLEAAGLPMNLYHNEGYKGTQLNLNKKKLAPDVDIKNADLSYADLSGLVAEGIDFSGCNLTGSLMTCGFFAGANFSDARLRNTDFTNSDLTNAIFRNAVLIHTDFEIADCSGADFTGANISGGIFKGTLLKNVKR